MIGASPIAPSSGTRPCGRFVRPATRSCPSRRCTPRSKGCKRVRVGARRSGGDRHGDGLSAAGDWRAGDRRDRQEGDHRGLVQPGRLVGRAHRQGPGTRDSPHPGVQHCRNRAQSRRSSDILAGNRFPCLFAVRSAPHPSPFPPRIHMANHKRPSSRGGATQAPPPSSAAPSRGRPPSRRTAVTTVQSSGRTGSRSPAAAGRREARRTADAVDPSGWARRGRGLNISELKDMSIQKLTQVAKELNVAGATGHAEAGADLPDPEGADRAERVHLLGGRARSAARRVRVPARAGLQLPAGARRHLRLALADSQVRSPDRRHRLGSDSAAEGRASATSPSSRSRPSTSRPPSRRATSSSSRTSRRSIRRSASSSRPSPTTCRRASWI